MGERRCKDSKEDASFDLTACATATDKNSIPVNTLSELSDLVCRQQGYDADFDPPLENKYECPICLMALRIAVQTPCGHRFCRGCIERSVREAGSRCPVDNEILTLDQLFVDNFANREILSLVVNCCNNGCHQKMELRYLDAHLAQCQFSTEQCPLCQAVLQKSQLEEHTSQHCPRRLVSCPACMEKYISEERQVHDQWCPLSRVVCKYCHAELIRDHLTSHCDTDCPEAVVTCTFSSFGCEEKMSRSALAQHMQEFTLLHLNALAAFLMGQSQYGDPPRVEPTGEAAWETSAVTSREMDTAVRVTMDHTKLQQMQEMVQQLEGRLVRQNHQLRELTIRSHAQAAQLQDLRSQTAALEGAVGEMRTQQCSGVFTWCVQGFTEHLKSHRANQSVILYSPGFYTGRPGYKLCLRLQLQPPTVPHNPNFLSLFVHTMRGAFDKQLAWPLQGSFKLTILDQREGQHITEVMETKPDLLAFQCPTADRNLKGFGYVTFVHLSKLCERYVEDNVLRVQCEAKIKVSALRETKVL
ncbi:hypothetical protein ACEWY4_010870 [Coilia grayii]|uniref:TNF receptor-associated factor n=1 Tax=Coilia grayii TaxID=363190 RepID=A0ABD1K3Q2_9TELE